MTALCTHLCLVCEGEAFDTLCVCDGRGIVPEALAREMAEQGCTLRPLPPLPVTAAVMPAPCEDCAFRRGSPEREDPSAWAALQRSVADGKTFYCHQGMHLTARGRYVPRAEDAEGVPVGHPLCAGYVRARAQIQRTKRA